MKTHFAMMWPLLLGACASSSSSSSSRRPTLTETTASVLPAPPGQLVCTATNDFGETIELFVQGDTGTLRRKAATGRVANISVRTTIKDGYLYADDQRYVDITVYAATVRQASPTLREMRVGTTDDPWLRCK